MISLLQWKTFFNSEGLFSNVFRRDQGCLGDSLCLHPTSNKNLWHQTLKQLTDCGFTLLIFSVNYVNYCQMNAALLLFPLNRYSVEQPLWEDHAFQLFNFKHKHSNNITNILFLVYLLFFLHLFCVECKLDPNFALWSHPN